MTPNEYIIDHKVKPLTQKEIKKGKSSLRISNTDDPMPWDEIYDRLRLGEPVENVAKEYGHVRKIALFAVRDKVEINPVLQKAVTDLITSRETMREIELADPITAMTIQETANRYSPTLAQKIVKLGESSMMDMQKIIDNGECTTNDHKNISASALTWGDIIGLTQRHASAAQLNVLKPAVDAFEFVEDYQEAEVIPSES